MMSKQSGRTFSTLPHVSFKILPISAVLKIKIYLNILQQQQQKTLEFNFKLFWSPQQQPFHGAVKKPNRSGAEREDKTFILNPNLKYSLYIFKITLYCFTATENPCKTLIREIKIKIYSC